VADELADDHIGKTTITEFSPGCSSGYRGWYSPDPIRKDYCLLNHMTPCLGFETVVRALKHPWQGTASIMAQMA
jgi:hypothetical protein